MKQILDNLLTLQNMELSKQRVSPSGTPREELRQTIPVQVLEHYDRLRSRGKKGVAFVRNGVCGQCICRLRWGCWPCCAAKIVLTAVPIVELTCPTWLKRPRRWSCLRVG